MKKKEKGRDRDRQRGTDRADTETERRRVIVNYYRRIKIQAQVGYFTNLSLMFNTETLNRANERE